MIKRWMAILFVIFLGLQACTFSLPVPTSIPPQPGEISPTAPPQTTQAVTLAAATKGATNTATPVQPAATITRLPATPTVKIPTPAPVVPTSIPVQYRLQPGTPLAMGGFVHSDLGCNWMGAGGQVFSLDSTPVNQLVVELGGTLDGQAISQLSLTGSAADWGPGGYEFTLANHPIESSGTLWLRLLNLNGDPVSDRIYFTTYKDCSKNVILINLNEVFTKAVNRTFMPLIGR